MNPKESRTPEAASDIKFFRPRKSFVLPRALTTTPMSSKFVTSILQSSANGTRLISTAINEKTGVERGAPQFIEASIKKMIKFDSHHQAYKHIDGTKPIVKLTDKDNLEYIAEYSLDGTVKELVVMKDEEFRIMFGTHFLVGEASGYSTEPPKTNMEKAQTLAEMPSKRMHPTSKRR